MGAGAPLTRDMAKERWVVVVQSRGEKELNCSHDCGTGREAPHVAKPPMLTCARTVATAKTGT